MSDASQDVPEAPVGERLAGLIEDMLAHWPESGETARVTLDMTFDQWGELLDTLRRGAT
jgi:hypothetical protein